MQKVAEQNDLVEMTVQPQLSATKSGVRSLKLQQKGALYFFLKVRAVHAHTGMARSY